MAKFVSYDNPQIDFHRHYYKRSLINRYRVLGPNGVTILTVPLHKDKHSQCPISDLKISYDEHWHRQHLRSIRSYYGSAPYYEHYIEPISILYRMEFADLSDLINSCLSWLLEEIASPQRVQNTVSYIRESNEAIDYRDIWTTRQEMGMKLDEYPQVFRYKQDFVKNLSILDLLMNIGPGTLKYLKSSITVN